MQTSTQSATTKVSKRGSGGTWRAFVHCHTTGEKWGPQTLSNLANVYRNLSEEDRAVYSSVGKTATLNRQLGVPSFPAWSARASRARHGHAGEDKKVPEPRLASLAAKMCEVAVVGALAPDAQAHLETMQQDEPSHANIFTQLTRAVARHFREVGKAEHADNAADALKELAPQSKTAAEDFLIDRKHLLDLQTCTWHSFPGPCPTLLASFEPDNVMPFAKHSGSPGSLHLAQGWQQRHLGIEQRKWEHGEVRLATNRRRMCLASSFCRCRGNGKLVAKIHGRFMRHLKQLCQEKHVEDLMVSGHMLLQFVSIIQPDPTTSTPCAKRPRASTASSSSSSAQVGSGTVLGYRGEALFYIVALMYLKPWRPTCVALKERTPDTFDKMLAVAVKKAEDVVDNAAQFEPASGQDNWGQRPKAFECAQSSAGGPECMTIWEVLGSLNLENREWWVKPWCISTGQAVVTSLSNCVFAEPSSLPAAKIWDSSMLRRPRRRGMRRDARPLHEIIDLQDSEGVLPAPVPEEHVGSDSAQEESENDSDVEMVFDQDTLMTDFMDALGPVGEDVPEDQQNRSAGSGELANPDSVLDDGGGNNVNNSSSSSTSDSSSSSSSSDSDSSPERPSGAVASEPVLHERPAGGERTPREALQVRLSQGGRVVGILKHQPGQSSFYAVCAKHKSCVKTRTYKCSNRLGAGRPVGFLCGWLHISDEHETKASHMAAMPSFQTRLAAREVAQTEWNSSDFLDLERGLEEGEGIEPAALSVHLSPENVHTCIQC